MQQYSPSFEAVRDSARTMMLGVLDANQQKLFWALIERNKLRADSVNRVREGAR